MTTNKKYGEKLLELKRKLKETEVEVFKGKEEIKDLDRRVEWNKENAQRTNLCLFFSILLTVAVIIIAILLCSFSSSDTVKAGSVFGAVFAIYIINYIIACIAQDEFIASYLLGLIPPLVFFAPFVEIYNIIVECKDNISYLKTSKYSLNNQKSIVRKRQKQLNDIKCEINEIEGYINNASSLYNRAVSENNQELMKKAADEGNANAIRYLAEEIYKQATAGETVDKELLNQAAALGHNLANMELGNELFDKGISNQYTKVEKTSLLKKAQQHYEIVLNNKNVEGEFMYMMCSVICDECESLPDLSVALARVRFMKEQKLLPENFEYNIDYLIEKLVELIDSESRKNTVILDDDFIKRADAEYRKMLGISDEPITSWVDINTGLPM